MVRKTPGNLKSVLDCAMVSRRQTDTSSLAWKQLCGPHGNGQWITVSEAVTRTEAALGWFIKDLAPHWDVGSLLTKRKKSSPC